MNRLNYYCRPFCGIPVDENNKVIINLPMILKMVTLAVRCPQRVPWDKRHKAGKEFWNGYKGDEE